jgi:hypothetical protein
MDINEIIFSKTAPQKKLDVINSLSEDELLITSKETVKRTIKECGVRVSHSRNNRLLIDYDRPAGNNWNSLVESFELIFDSVQIDIYVQDENADTNKSEYYSNFFSGGSYRGEVRRLDRYGNGRTYYFIYERNDKAKVMKSLLLEYVHTKYKNKLNQKGKEDGA